MAMLKKSFLVVVLLGILGAAGAEAMLWIFDPQPESPAAEFVFEQDMPGVRPRVEYVVNEQSLRVLNWAAGGKKEGAKRILFLGGASTDLFMHAAEDTWWGLAWKKVNAETDFEVEAASMGTEGDTILTGVKWYRDHLEEIDADVLVVTYGLGDVLQNGSEYRYDPGKFDRTAGDGRPAWKKVAGAYSQVYRYRRVERIREAFDARRRAVGERNFLPALFREWHRHYAQLPYAEEVGRQPAHDPLLEYLDGIDRFIELCRLTGTKLIVLGEATLHDGFAGPDEMLLLRQFVRTGPESDAIARPNPAWVGNELERFYEAASRRCAEEDVPFYFLNREVPKSHKLFLDDSLFTLKGCEKVADVVALPLAALLTGGEAPRAQSRR